MKNFIDRWMLRRWAIFTYMAAIVTYFILVSLKIEDVVGLTHMIIFIPNGVGHLVLGMALAITAVLHPGDTRLFCSAAVVIIAGSLLTQLFLSLKADFLVSMTYLETLIPLLVAFIFSGVAMVSIPTEGELSQTSQKKIFRSITQVQRKAN